MLCSVFKIECTVLIFLFEKQLFKEHYVIHLIFKNGVNNTFPSQTSFLLLSSDTHASFANRPIKFCCCKPNTWRHVFANVVYVLLSKFSCTTAFFCCRSFFQIQRSVITYHLHISNHLCNTPFIDLVCYFKIWQRLLVRKL